VFDPARFLFSGYKNIGVGLIRLLIFRPMPYMVLIIMKAAEDGGKLRHE
jgi:hypothetical protein